MTVYEKGQLTNELEFLRKRLQKHATPGGGYRSREMSLVITKLDEARLWLNEVPTSDPDE